MTRPPYVPNRLDAGTHLMQALSGERKQTESHSPLPVLTNAISKPKLRTTPLSAVSLLLPS